MSTTQVILKAASIITMDESTPRAEAVAIDCSTGTIIAVGSLDDCTKAAPGAAVTDLGTSVLMPGFIDPHSHPMLSGMATQAPAHWIAPWEGCPTFADVEALFRKVDTELPKGQAAVFNGLDRLLQGAPELDSTQLDGYFPDRPALVLDNSGHEVYFNSAVITLNGWVDGKPPADPPGARYGRNADGTSNGRAYETAAMLAAAEKTLAAAVPHPLLSAARWYALMARNGVVATSEHTYTTKFLKGYEALAMAPDCPVRLALYHMAIEPDCAEKLDSQVPAAMLWKQGIKLWADGSPWNGTIAISFPYLDNDTTKKAQIAPGARGESAMNYSRSQIDGMLDANAPDGWQMAVHVNGDVGLDVVLDAYERALAKTGLAGTDHRWRVEHCGAARGDQFDRAATMGVTASLLPAQFIYWGDVLDGVMFESEIGSQWVRAGDAVKSGTVTTFHNDGSVSPPIPLLNMQAMVTRRCASGNLHGPQQMVSMDDALRAHTVHAAWQIGRDKDLGSITAGKLADLVELSSDPLAAEPAQLTEQVTVVSTWRAGGRVDLGAFLKGVEAMDPTEHQHLAAQAAVHHCCAHSPKGHGH